MKTTDNLSYQPPLTEGARVWLMKHDHPESSHTATIVQALPNPSKLQEHQWYDVRFDNGVYGRFLERYLEQVEGGVTKDEEEKSGDQASVV